MKTYKIKRKSGKTDFVQAKDFQQAKKIVYGTTNWKVMWNGLQTELKQLSFLPSK